MEIFMVNDGSTDGSKKILNSIAKNDTRVKIISQRNCGVSAARNTGLSYASGLFIAFVDSDDYCAPEMLAMLAKALKKHPVDLASCGIVEENRLGHVLRKRAACTIVEPCLEKCGPALQYNSIDSACAKIYYADIIRKNGLKFDESVHMGEDACFVRNYLCHCTRGIASSEDYFYHYVRSNGNSLSNRYYPDYEKYLAVLYHQSLKLQTAIPTFQFEDSLESFSAIRVVWNLFKKDCPLSNAQKRVQILRFMDSPNYREAVIHNRRYGLKSWILAISFRIRSPRFLALGFSFGTKLWALIKR